MRVTAVVVVTMNVARIQSAVSQATGEGVTVARTMLTIRVNQRKVILIQRMSVKNQRSPKVAAAVARNQRAKRLKRKANPIVIVVVMIATAARENDLSIVIKVNIRRKPKRVSMRDHAHVPDPVKGVAGSTNIKGIVYLKTSLFKLMYMCVPSVDALVCILMQDYH